MVLVKYSSEKLLLRALLFLVGGFGVMVSVIGFLLGIYLVAYGLRALWKAAVRDKAAIILHARGLEVRTLWRTYFVSYDDYRKTVAETVFVHFAGIPIPGPTMLAIHVDKGKLLGKRRLRILLGYLKVSESGVAMIAEAIELYAMPHREAGEVWHQVIDERNAALGGPPPPRQLPTKRVRNAARRDPLEGARGGDLDRPPERKFGRKILQNQ